MNKWKNIYLITIFLCTVFSLHAQDYSQYQKKLFIDKGDTLQYRILYPLNNDTEIKYPLIIFFHGAALRGNDNEKQLRYGAELFLKEYNRKNYPATVIFPQCPSDSLWVNYRIIKDSISEKHFFIPINTAATTPLKLSAELIEQLINEGHVDKSRIYAGGQSLGGLATFDMLWRYPQFFAAAFPIAGTGNPMAVKYYDTKTPVWIFHGAKDNVVPYINSKIMYEAMKQQGLDVKYTLYPDAKHNSWDSAFAEKELLPWIFSKKRAEYIN